MEEPPLQRSAAKPRTDHVSVARVDRTLTMQRGEGLRVGAYVLELIGDGYCPRLVVNGPHDHDVRGVCLGIPFKIGPATITIREIRRRVLLDVNLPAKLPLRVIPAGDAFCGNTSDP